MEIRMAKDDESSLQKMIEEDAIRRRRERERNARRRKNETPEQTQIRREKERERTARRRRNENPSETALRRLQDRKRKANRIKDETPEEKLFRRERDRERKAKCRLIQRERGVQRRRRERERTGQRRRRNNNSNNINNIPASFCPDTNYTTTTKTQQHQLQIAKKDNEKTEPFTQDYQNRSRASSRSKPPSETLSSADALFQHFLLPEPTDAELQMKQESRQMAFSGATLIEDPPHPARDQMCVPQHLEVASSSHSQSCPRQEQVVTHPAHVVVSRTKPPEKPQVRQEKQLLAIANHQRGIMTRLASLWKSGKLCDAGLGNGSATVKVHKVVLSAVCPKLLSVFSADMFSHKFMQVNFPEKVSEEALKAFAEYMYYGLLNLDHNILEQLKIIANKLDMKEFEKLCDHHLPKHMQQPISSSVSANVPFVQPTVPIPAMTSSSLASAISNSMPSSSSDLLDIKQEITEDDLAQVLFGRDSEVTSLAPNKSGNDVVVTPTIKTEPVGPEDNKYGHWSGDHGSSGGTTQAFPPTISASSSSSTAPAAIASSSIVSVPGSATEFAAPFTEGADDKSTRLNSLIESELSAVSAIVEQFSSKSNHTSEESPGTLPRPSVPMTSTDGPSTSTSSEGVYPVELFTSVGGNLPLITGLSVGGKTLDLYQTDLT